VSMLTTRKSYMTLYGLTWAYQCHPLDIAAQEPLSKSVLVAAMDAEPEEKVEAGSEPLRPEFHIVPGTLTEREQADEQAEQLRPHKRKRITAHFDRSAANKRRK
jgi:hypothetical protein